MATSRKALNKRQRKLNKASKHSQRFTSDELWFQPWFLPGRIAFAIRSIAPPDYHLKMRYFFDDYGCIVCKKDHNYGSNGMCVNCYRQVRKRLSRSVRRRLKPLSERRFDLGLIRQARLAEKLLESFTKGHRAPPARRVGDLRPTNPVDEALGPHSERARMQLDGLH